MYLVHKKHLINEEQFVLPEGGYLEDYIAIQKVEKKSKYNLDEMANGYIEMGSLVEESNENNDNYIFEPKLVSGKAL